MITVNLAVSAIAFNLLYDFTSDHAHFTFFDIIRPLSLSWVFGIQTNGYTEKLSYCMQVIDMTYINVVNFVCHHSGHRYLRSQGRCSFLIHHLIDLLNFSFEGGR